jgi:hypothetical protein
MFYHFTDALLLLCKNKKHWEFITNFDTPKCYKFVALKTVLPRLFKEAFFVNLCNEKIFINAHNR